MSDTLFGREVKFDESLNEDIFVVNPKTWERVRKIAYRNAVVVETSKESQCPKSK